MKLAKNIGFYLGFVAASALFLVVEHFTHIEFFLHVAAIPLEVLVAVFIVEKMLERREAERNERLMTKVRKVLGDGIQKFLDYAIELKEKQPKVFADLMTDYEISDRMHLSRPLVEDRDQEAT
jgi:hypothetical protein